MALYQREESISINHARRFASQCITARQHFALRLEKRKAYVTGPEGSEDEIERIIAATADKVVE